MYHHPIAQSGAGVDDHARVDAAVAADAHSSANHGPTADDGGWANADSLLNRGMGADRDVTANLYLRGKHGRRMDGRNGLGATQQHGGPGERQARLGGTQNGLTSAAHLWPN